MDCKIDKELPRVLDYDEGDCQCIECHQKRKYARGKKISGHTPPVDLKRSYFWYQISCTTDGKNAIKFFALCPHTKKFSRMTLRPDIAMRSPPFVIRPDSKDCAQGTECHNTDCNMSKNPKSDISKGLVDVYSSVKDSLKHGWSLLGKMKIQVLGADCNKCQYLFRFMNKMVKEHNVNAEVHSVAKMADILKFGVMMTPALVIDGKVICVGRVPSKREIRGWLGVKVKK
jgi:small redox-active disulfide protein 2